MMPGSPGGSRVDSPVQRAPRWLAWGWLCLGLFIIIVSSALAWLQPGSLPRADRTPANAGFWQQFFLPIETNSFQKLIATPADLYTLRVGQDGQRAWVASGSTVLRTTNTGRTWDSIGPLLSNPSSTIQDLVFTRDAKQGFAVTSEGTLLVSQDGGASWRQRVRAPGDPHHWEFIGFSEDGQFGIAVSNESGVFTSTDLGRRWQRKQLPTADPVRIQSLHVGSSGKSAWLTSLDKVFGTGDGATTWSERPVQVFKVHVDRTGKRIWGAAADGIRYSDDGGNTWRTQDVAGGAVSDIFFNEDGRRGWAVGISGRAFRTVDGGQTWQGLPSGADQSLMRVRSSQDGTVVMAVGARGAVLVSHDGGNDWRSATRPAVTQQTVAASADLSHAWVAREGGIHMTTDAGRHWSRNTSPYAGQVVALTFDADLQRGWAVTRSAIIATHDGGATWAIQHELSTPAATASIAFLAGGVQGWAVVGAEVLSTRNGGDQWIGTPELAGKGIHRVLPGPEGQRGWALGGGVVWSSVPGAGWQPVANDVSFHDAVLADDGKRGFAIDTTHTYYTSNGGATWARKPCAYACSSTAVATSGDGMQAWVASSDGAIEHTANGGVSWTAQQVDLPGPLIAIRFSRDGMRGLAIGALGEIARSDDGGQSWHPAEVYARAPAPWYWVTIVLAAIPVWLAWHLRPSGIARQSIADVGTSDAAIANARDDRLEFRGLARGISRFLRNPATGAPLTLAISGDWGSGKSSLMQLLCADLRRFRHFPIWFNAWHHQKEEHLFAALLGAVRKQAVPPLHSVAGLSFRLRLLWMRSKQHFVIMLLLLFIATLLIDRTAPQIAHADFMGVVPALKDITDMWQPLAVLIGTVVTTLAAITLAAKPFHVNPAVLLATLRDKMSIKIAAAQNDFRDQFASQFSELTAALPQRLVIVIDDLDRCRPAAVLDVMEAINYLTSAGECVVIFGMARERVLASLGLAFREIADELVLMDSMGTAGEGGGDPAVARRRNYAADYLQKLVNIEVAVPPTRDRPLHALLVAPDSAPRRTLLGALASLRKLWPLLAAATAIGAALYLPQPTPATTPDAAVSQAEPQGPRPSANAAAQPAAPGTLALPPKALVPSGAVQPGQQASTLSILGWLALASMPLAVAATVVALRLLRRNINETRDSKTFLEALEIWTPLVAARRATPRAIKRFGNRMRYLAMLQQGEQDDETRGDVVKRRIASVLRRPIAAPARATVDALAEHQLIAIGAIHELYGAKWEQPVASPPPVPDAESHDPAAGILRAAIAAHRRAFGADWPPDEREVAVFKRLLSGVRLAGDPMVLGTERPARRAGGGASQQAQSSSESPIHRQTR